MRILVLSFKILMGLPVVVCVAFPFSEYVPCIIILSSLLKNTPTLSLYLCDSPFSVAWEISPMFQFSVCVSVSWCFRLKLCTRCAFPCLRRAKYPLVLCSHFPRLPRFPRVTTHHCVYFSYDSEIGPGNRLIRQSSWSRSTLVSSVLRFTSPAS